jgi:hypothetical protein
MMEMNHVPVAELYMLYLAAEFNTFKIDCHPSVHHAVGSDETVILRVTLCA